MPELAKLTLTNFITISELQIANLIAQTIVFFSDLTRRLQFQFKLLHPTLQRENKRGFCALL